MRHAKLLWPALLPAVFPAAAHAALPEWVRPFSDISAGNTAWLLTATGLVLFMTIPGLALFYAGMVRKKNILATMMQSLGVASLVAVLWVVVGYSIAFTPNNGFIGGLDRLFLMGMDIWTAEETLTIYPGADSIPEPVFMTFQMTFAIISTAILTGSFAERIKFSALLWFAGLWVLLVYAPTAHWVWESGGWLAGHGVLDYAGGTVVHINAGMAGLVGAVILGRRIGHGREAMPPANLSLTLMGAAMIWVGWFGFNAGSALAADARAGMALAVTQIAAAVGALTWVLCEVLHRRKPSALGWASGAVSGLVGITPAAGFVNVPGALVIGIVTGAACYWSVTILKRKLGYDDTLDAFGIHGFGGIVGAVLTGLVFSGSISGLEISIWRQTGIQMLGAVITIVYSGAVSFILLKILDKTIGLRVTDTHERVGLDISLHGERLE